MKDILIIGASDLARELFYLIQELNEQKKEFKCIGFSDADPKVAGTMLCGLPVIAEEELYTGKIKASFVFGIADPKTKSKILAKLPATSAFTTLIHPSIAGGHNLEIGAGSIITQNVFIGPDTTIGQHVLVNIGAIIGHDVEIGDFALVCPGCHISGRVTIGQAAIIGTGASIMPGLAIGERSRVALGSAVLTNVAADSLVIGVPAKKIA